MLFFHYKFSSIWHSRLITKWHGCPKYHMKMWLDKIISNITKNDYANDMDKTMCHYIYTMIIKLLYNDSKMIIGISSHIRNYDM